MQENIVARRLFQHLNDTCLYEKLQPAYTTRHSTATTLMRVLHDSISYMTNSSCANLVLLDLSPAFDILNYVIVLKTMHYYLGISSAAFAWFD